MTPGVVVNFKKASSEPLLLYAARFARKCLLEHLCSPEHPVLDVERQLISEARIKLHEHLLRNGWNRVEAEAEIRQFASEKAAVMIEDVGIQKLVMAAIRSKSLDDAFPNVN